MSIQEWRPSKGEKYYLISAYSPDAYEFVWQGSKADLSRLAGKTLYPTKEAALEAKKQTSV